MVFQKRDAGIVPVAGAQVEVRPVGGGEVLHRVETGSMGRYYLGGLEAGELVVTVRHPRYYMAAATDESGRTVRCPRAGVCTGGDFEMLPSGELEVSVVDSFGLPVEDASVQVLRLDEPKRTWSPVLRAVGGIYRVPGMAPGRYRVEAGPVELRGIVYHRAALDLDFPRGAESHSVRLVMSSERRYRVAGRILGLDAAEEEAVMVLLELQQPEGAVEPRRLGAPVGSGGHFALNGVPAGRYALKLVWEQDSRFDLSNGSERLLDNIEVEGDVTGLVYTKPSIPVAP